MTSILFNPKVRDKLDLTQDQKEKIQELMKEAGPKFKEAFAGFKEDKEATLKKLSELQKSLLADALKILNDDQRKAYEELRGEPFKGVLPGGFFGMGGMGMGMGGATGTQIEARLEPRRQQIAALT